ncbi:hypothetical protein D3C72_2548580 [compost metagenome]
MLRGLVKLRVTDGHRGMARDDGEHALAFGGECAGSPVGDRDDPQGIALGLNGNGQEGAMAEEGRVSLRIER